MELHERNKLIEKHLGLVERLAKAKKRSLPSQIYYEDLESVGYFGLVEAANRYESQQGNFDTFASSRIMGEMIEYLRELARYGMCSNRTPLHSVPTLTSLDNEAEVTLIYCDPVSSNDFFDKVARPLGSLGGKIIRWYFLEDRTEKDIGEKLGVAEGYVSQLLIKYKDKIRKTFSEFELRQEIMC